MLEDIPSDDDYSKEREQNDKEPFYAWRAPTGKGLDVHAKEANDEGCGEEDEGYPGEPPHGGAKLERGAGVMKGNRSVHLQPVSALRSLNGGNCGLLVD